MPPVPIQRLPPSCRSSLLAHALLEQPPQLLEVQRLERRQLLGGQVLSHLGVAQPLLELPRQLERLALDTAEAREEGLVEGVEVGLAVDAERASHVVEPVERAVVQAHLQRAGEGHRLLEAHLDLALAQLEEKRDEHPSASGERRTSQL